MRQTRSGGRETTVPKQAQDYSQLTEYCQKCGLKHNRKQCPTCGQKCLNCGKYNHHAKFCKSKKKLQTVGQAQSGDDDELSVTESEVLVIDAIKKQGSTEKIIADQCYSTLDVQGTSLKFKIDIWSQANIIPAKVYSLLPQQPTVRICAPRLTSYTGGDLCVRAQCVLKCHGQNLHD